MSHRWSGRMRLALTCVQGHNLLQPCLAHDFQHVRWHLYRAVRFKNNHQAKATTGFAFCSKRLCLAGGNSRTCKGRRSGLEHTLSARAALRLLDSQYQPDYCDVVPFLKVAVSPPGRTPTSSAIQYGFPWKPAEWVPRFRKYRDLACVGIEWKAYSSPEGS